MSNQKINSWQSVREEVVRRIQVKTWKQGDLIPGEAALAEEFGCARATVNRALQDLSSAGILDRKRKSGTRVATLPMRKATLKIPIIRQEITDRGYKYKYALISREETNAAEAGVRESLFPKQASLLHVIALHSADGSPYVLEQRWINTSAAPAARDADFTTQSPNEWLVANIPFSGGDIAFSASNAGKTDARLLRCRATDGVFNIQRETRHEGRVITSVRLVFAAGYRLETTL